LRVRISHLVNSLTRQALYEQVPGYVGKEADFLDLESKARAQYGFDRLLRFDLGENAEGCSPKVLEFIQGMKECDLRHFLSGYPESAAVLKCRLAELNNMPTQWIALGTGVVSFISNICHAFYEWGDRVLLPTPTFFVIEEYTLRAGALPIYLPMSYEEGFRWTTELSERVIHQMQCLPIKMLWLCSPNNPTGQPVPFDEVERLVRAAEESFCMVVVDEAYGEFTDDRLEYQSAVRLLSRFENLIVLRSFSKAHGLAGMRIGYAMMASEIVHAAIARQMEYFPVTKLSVELANVATGDQGYISDTREHTRAETERLHTSLRDVPSVECIPTETNISLCRMRGFTTTELKQALLKQGILVADAESEGLTGQGWVRVTCRSAEDNRLLATAYRNAQHDLADRC